MDNVEHLPEVQCDGADGDDLRPGSESRASRLTPADLRELRFDDLLRIGELLIKYQQLDVPKEDVSIFLLRLTQDRNSWFVEAGDVGIMFLTDVRPRLDAMLSVFFWDGSLALDRVAAVKMFLADAFTRFDLDRVSVDVPYENMPMKRFLKDVGFILEGVTRRGWSVDPPVDIIHFGMLREEASDIILPLGGD